MWDKISSGSIYELDQSTVGTCDVGETTSCIYQVKTVAVIGQSKPEITSSDNLVITVLYFEVIVLCRFL